MTNKRNFARDGINADAVDNFFEKLESITMTAVATAVFFGGIWEFAKTYERGRDYNAPNNEAAAYTRR